LNDHIEAARGWIGWPPNAKHTPMISHFRSNGYDTRGMVPWLNGRLVVAMNVLEKAEATWKRELARLPADDFTADDYMPDSLLDAWRKLKRAQIHCGLAMGRLHEAKLERKKESRK
jgi:hypothetical protein